MKFLYKIITTMLIIALLCFSFSSCKSKQVSFYEGSNSLLNVISKLQEKTSVDENNNFYYDCTTKKYLSNIKCLLTCKEYKESYSYYKDNENSTAVYYKYEKDSETTVDYTIKSDKFTYGLAIDNNYYVFNENSVKSKAGTDRADKTILQKHKLNDFSATLQIEKTEKYYYTYAETIFDLWNETETHSINTSDIENAKFYYEKESYNMSCIKQIPTETGKITKELNISFDNDNISFIEVIIEMLNQNNEQIGKVWKKLTVVMQSGMADIPSELENFENY
jgi:hypothetical protein